MSFAAFLLLGYWVWAHHEPAKLWWLDRQLRGHGVPPALVFTAMGRAFVLGPLYALAILVAIFSPRWRVPALFAVASGLLCWGAADLFQHVFMRPRRADWLVFHETAYSYPSSHAATALGFYYVCGLLAFRSSLRVVWRYVLYIGLVLLTLAITWSRLALAAHYVTDVIGGLLLGAAVVWAAGAALECAGVDIFGKATAASQGR